MHQFIKCEGGANAEEDMKKVQSFNVSRSRGKKVRREAEKSFDETDSSSSKYSVEGSEGSTELSDLEDYYESVERSSEITNVKFIV